MDHDFMLIHALGKCSGRKNRGFGGYHTRDLVLWQQEQEEETLPDRSKTSKSVKHKPAQDTYLKTDAIRWNK